MRIKHLVVPVVAVFGTAGLVLPQHAGAGEGKALSYVNVNNIQFSADLGEVIILQADIPASSTAASKLGIPDAGSGELDTDGGGPLNPDQACVARIGNDPSV